MAQTLDQIGQVKGPIEEFPNPHPTPEISTKIAEVAVQEHAPLLSALLAEGPPLLSVKNATFSARGEYERARQDLAEPRNELGKVSFNTEILELQVAENAKATIDGKLAELAARNPAGVTLPPITFETPELDAVLQSYLLLELDWDYAWPLWPFVAPG